MRRLVGLATVYAMMCTAFAAEANAQANLVGRYTVCAAPSSNDCDYQMKYKLNMLSFAKIDKFYNCGAGPVSGNGLAQKTCGNSNFVFDEIYRTSAAGCGLLIARVFCLSP